MVEVKDRIDTTSTINNVPPTDIIDISTGGYGGSEPFGNEEFKQWRRRFKSYNNLRFCKSGDNDV